MARGQGLRRRRDRLDALAADAADDRAGEVEQHAQQADVRAALRDRLRRSAGKGNHPGAQGRASSSSPDRYIFTALARAGVRGVDRPWLRNLYGFAIAPHLVFYLKIDVDTLIGRVLEVARHGLLGIGHGSQERRRHLRQLPHLSAASCCANTRSMADEFHFRVLDARRSIDKIQDELRRQVQAFLEPRTAADQGIADPQAQYHAARQRSADDGRRRSDGSNQADQCVAETEPSSVQQGVANPSQPCLIADQMVIVRQPFAIGTAPS